MLVFIPFSCCSSCSSSRSCFCRLFLAIMSLMMDQVSVLTLATVVHGDDEGGVDPVAVGETEEFGL